MTFEQNSLFIGGQWVTPSESARMPVISPATEEQISSIPDASTTDVDRAVSSARDAFDHGEWPRMTPKARAEVLSTVAEQLGARTEDMAATLTAEMGSPITQSRLGQIPTAVDLVNFYASQAEVYPWEERRSSYDAANEDFDVVVQQDPVGVVGAIVPWNGPQICTIMKVAPALLAGCTVVIKPAPEATLNFVGFAEAFEAAGLPPGVLNVVTGGVTAGERLVTHPDVDKVAFTGSVGAGRKIATLCGERLRHVTLELGGKSPAVLLEDADVEYALSNLLVPMLFVSGQACNAPTRILAPRSRYEEVVDALVAAIDAVPYGVPNDPDTVVGPLASAAQRDRVLGYIEAGRSEGANVALGGGQPAGYDRGWYVEKTVFRDVDNSMKIAQEEIFGPVSVAIPYDDEEDAIRIANDSRLGLAGSVWSADPQRGYRVASRLRSGSLGVNQHNLDCAAPLAGMRDSGIGVERGPEAIREYVSPKGMLVPRS